jgi:hypothetical protein
MMMNFTPYVQMLSTQPSWRYAANVYVDPTEFGSEWHSAENAHDKQCTDYRDQNHRLQFILLNVVYYDNDSTAITGHIADGVQGTNQRSVKDRTTMPNIIHCFSSCSSNIYFASLPTASDTLLNPSFLHMQKIYSLCDVKMAMTP